MMELRWYDTGVRKVLQYRFYSDVGGPYPNYQWSEWMEVPTVEAPMVNEITAEAVSYLREISDCSMMECKKALTACRGDMVKAAEWLRTHRGFYLDNGRR